MSQHELPSEILALPVADRIELVAQIWDSIEEDAKVGLSAAQRAILEQRLAAHRSDPGEGTSWSEVKKDLRDDQ